MSHLVLSFNFVSLQSQFMLMFSQLYSNIGKGRFIQFSKFREILNFQFSPFKLILEGQLKSDGKFILWCILLVGIAGKLIPSIYWIKVTHA